MNIVLQINYSYLALLRTLEIYIITSMFNMRMLTVMGRQRESGTAGIRISAVWLQSVSV